MPNRERSNAPPPHPVREAPHRPPVTNTYQQMVQARATAPAPPGTRPCGIPVDDTEFWAFVAKGGFTPDQVRTLRQMVPMMMASLAEGKAQGVITPAVWTETLGNISKLEAALAVYPLDTPANPFMKIA